MRSKEGHVYISLSTGLGVTRDVPTVGLYRSPTQNQHRLLHLSSIVPNMYFYLAHSAPLIPFDQRVASA